MKLTSLDFQDTRYHLRASIAVGPLKCTGLFEMRLAHEQKERQAKGNSNEHRPDDGRPKLFHVETTALSENERDKNEGRCDNIKTEEAADPIGEQFMNEQRNVKPVIHHPRNELRVGQHRTYNAEDKVSDSHVHRPRASEPGGPSAEHRR